MHKCHRSCVCVVGCSCGELVIGMDNVRHAWVLKAGAQSENSGVYWFIDTGIVTEVHTLI